MERSAIMAIGHSDPIILPGRKPLITLRDAALYSRNLPKAGRIDPSRISIELPDSHDEKGRFNADHVVAVEYLQQVALDESRF